MRLIFGEFQNAIEAEQGDGYPGDLEHVDFRGGGLVEPHERERKEHGRHEARQVAQTAPEEAVEQEDGDRRRDRRG